MKNDNKLSYPCEGNNDCFNLEDVSFWFRQRNYVIESTAEKFAQDGTIADVGGGNGFVSAYLSKKFGKIEFILIEPGESGCENAKKRGLKKVFNKTLEQLDEYHVLNNIGIFDVIEHIEDDEKFLREIFEKLSPGGKVFITTPAYQFLWSSEDVAAGHYRRYTQYMLQERAIQSGFKVAYSSYFFLTLILPIFLYRVLPEKLGLNNHRNASVDHREGIFSTILENIMKLEMYFLKKGFRFPLGASIVMVLEKSIMHK